MPSFEKTFMQQQSPCLFIFKARNSVTVALSKTLTHDNPLFCPQSIDLVSYVIKCPISFIFYLEPKYVGKVCMDRPYCNENLLFGSKCEAYGFLVGGDQTLS